MKTLSYRLAHVSFLLQRVANKIYDTKGLTSYHWKVLSIVCSVRPMPATEIAKWVILDKAATSRSVAQLMKSGLVRRQLRQEDARIVDVMPTEEGRRLYFRLAGKMAAFQKELFEDLSEPEVRKLFEFIDHLDRKLDSSRS